MKRAQLILSFFIIWIITVILIFYSALVKQIGEPTSALYTKKYVIYECRNFRLCGGLADRLKMVINAYYWSLFTNRTLIVNITKPCNFVNLMAPNEINWALNLSELVKKGDLPKNYVRFDIEKLNGNYFKRELAKIDIINYHKEAHVIGLFSNLEWFTGYVQNGFLMDSSHLKPYLTHFSEAFQKSFNKLFRLNPIVQRKFDIYLSKAKPKNSSKLICIQARMHGQKPRSKTGQNLTDDFAQNYWRFVERNFLKKVNADDTKIFITSDTKSTELEAIRTFGADRVIRINGAPFHLDQENNFGDFCSPFDKIIMDFYMLGYCDMGLVSDSGFGILGVIRNRIPDKDFYVLSALKFGYSNPEIAPLKSFMYTNPHRY